jgi:hypothetical protein
MTWIREGYCCKCGQCCRGAIDGLPAQADGACPYLKLETNGERLCSIHNTVDTYWARGCNVWPTDPHNIENYDRCTFSFTWQDD